MDIRVVSNVDVGCTTYRDISLTVNGDETISIDNRIVVADDSSHLGTILVNFLKGTLSMVEMDAFVLGSIIVLDNVTALCFRHVIERILRTIGNVGLIPSASIHRHWNTDATHLFLLGDDGILDDALGKFVCGCL